VCVHVGQVFIIFSRYDFNLKDNDDDNQFELDLECPRYSSFVTFSKLTIFCM